MKAEKARTVWLLAVLAAQLGLAQAPLPTSWTGPWQTGLPPDGWTFHGLGGPDYNPDYDGLNDGAAKLDSTGDHIAIVFTPAAASVSYWIKGLTFTGGVFSVEQSVEGTNWTALATYTALPTNAAFHTHFPSLAARHLRFIYTTRGSGNVGLDGISIFAWVQPVVETFSTTGGMVRISIPESVAGRTYALEHTVALTNAPVIWMQDDSQSGTGSALVLRDLAPTNAARYYRVRDATP